MRRLLPLAALALVACPSPPPADDGGTGGGNSDDAGPPPACMGASDCKAMGFKGVCRQGLCAAHVPCTDDLECGLGEDCVNKECAFTGCVSNADCPTGLCRTDTFACAECGADSDCPFDKPSCQMPAQKCVQCADDSQCPEPGPSHCEAISGQCKGCVMDAHCPNGFKCGQNVCQGAMQGKACSTDVACSAGLTCVMLGSTQLCLSACNAYAPHCPTGQICYTLKYTGISSYVFDQGALLGVCYTPAMNARGYRDSCIRDGMGNSNCQPSLQCVPDSATGSSCRAYCDPGLPNSCPSPELCHPFVGDFSGRDYGLCYANNGYGDKCSGDKDCKKPGETCLPFDDPSAFDELSPICQFNVGSGAGLSPCGPVRLLDGGMQSGDKQCGSGLCVGSTVPSTGPYFCFASCATDDDCTIGSRTGTCDQQYPFTSSNGTMGYVPGCLPGCLSDATCNPYGDGGTFICRPRESIGPSGALKLNCSLPSGLKQAGEACTFSSECRSGFCQQTDSRGVHRFGYCLTACQTPSDCAVDAGSATGPLDCLPTSVLTYYGMDALPGTADDGVAVGRLCSGRACTQDDDCASDGGARCVPIAGGVDGGSFTLRCEAPASPGVLEAGATCNVDNDCVSGVCGTLTDGSNARVCFKACAMAGAACPGALSCKAAAFKVMVPGGPASLDGCAP